MRDVILEIVAELKALDRALDRSLKNGGDPEHEEILERMRYLDWRLAEERATTMHGAAAKLRAAASFLKTTDHPYSGTLRRELGRTAAAFERGERTMTHIVSLRAVARFAESAFPEEDWLLSLLETGLQGASRPMLAYSRAEQSV